MAKPTYVFGIPVDFILLALTLLGIAFFHHKTPQVALSGLAILGWKPDAPHNKQVELPAIQVTTGDVG